MGLKITRRVGEEFWIGPDIRIVIAELNGRNIRLEIDAPQSHVIHRDGPPSNYRPCALRGAISPHVLAKTHPDCDNEQHRATH